MTRIRAVLFDFDGTLTLPGGIDFAAIKRAIGCPADRPILEFIAAAPPRTARAARAVLERFEAEAARRAAPNAGAEALVAWLKRRRLRRGILTRNSLASVKTALANFARVRPSDFSVIVARDHVRRPKPDPEGVRQAARRMGVPPAALLVVGDYVFDIEAGQRAGARTAFLETADTIKRPDPPADFTLRALGDVAGIIKDCR